MLHALHCQCAKHARHPKFEEHDLFHIGAGSGLASMFDASLAELSKKNLYLIPTAADFCARRGVGRGRVAGQAHRPHTVFSLRGWPCRARHAWPDSPARDGADGTPDKLRETSNRFDRYAEAILKSWACLPGDVLVHRRHGLWCRRRDLRSGSVPAQNTYREISSVSNCESRRVVCKRASRKRAARMSWLHPQRLGTGGRARAGGGVWKTTRMRWLGFRRFMWVVKFMGATTMTWICSLP